MSAFVVSNRTMTRAIAALKYAGVADHFPCESEKELGDLLYDLNTLAVSDRYCEPKEVVSYQPEPGLAFTKVDAAKGLACLIYQCSEGNVPETPSFKLMEEAERILTKEIVSGLPEYRDAAWDSHTDGLVLVNGWHRD